ncbi:MAG TPA: CsbD family protein [Rhodanobacter sp.]|nr:CsbD family protein [Rhodanobacter sp.]
MNEDKLNGRWKQLHGKLKSRWGKLTDDDIDVANGDAEYLVGKLQERYGMAKDEAMKQLRDFNSGL